MGEPTQCEVCKKTHDFNKQCFGWCRTCDKKLMCEECCYTHPCIPGKSRQLAIITNPAWICNLVKTLDKEKLHSEWGGEKIRVHTSNGTVDMVDDLNKREEEDRILRDLINSSASSLDGFADIGIVSQ